MSAAGAMVERICFGLWDLPAAKRTRIVKATGVALMLIIWTLSCVAVGSWWAVLVTGVSFVVWLVHIALVLAEGANL